MTEQVRRASRLVEIEHRLRKHPQGLTVRELADGLGYSMRTIQRDLNVLESELGAPLVDGTGRRWRLMPGSTPIGAVRFTLQEARAVFLAARLLLRHADERDPDAVSALEKLANALPPGLGVHVQLAAEELKQKAPSPGATNVLRLLTQAWTDSRTIIIRYRSGHSREEKSVRLDPHLLEANAELAGTYVVGYSHDHEATRTFKVDRIMEAELTDDHFSPPDLADLRRQMRLGWGGAVLGEDAFDIALVFTAEVASRVAERHWHPSQTLVPQADGSLRFEVQLPSLLDFVPWVRSWGQSVRVAGPPELRAEIAESLRAAAAQYA